MGLEVSSDLVAAVLSEPPCAFGSVSGHLGFRLLRSTTSILYQMTLDCLPHRVSCLSDDGSHTLQIPFEHTFWKNITIPFVQKYFYHTVLGEMPEGRCPRWDADGKSRKGHSNVIGCEQPIPPGGQEHGEEKNCGTVFKTQHWVKCPGSEMRVSVRKDHF